MAGQKEFQFKQQLTCSQNDSLFKRNSAFVCEHRIYAFSSDLEAGGIDNLSLNTNQNMGVGGCLFDDHQ